MKKDNYTVSTVNFIPETITLKVIRKSVNVIRWAGVKDAWNVLMRRFGLWIRGIIKWR